MISQQEIDKLKSTLEAQLAELEERIAEPTVISVESKDTGDEADRASIEESQQLQINRRQHDLVHQKSIQDALARISHEDFGICELCGEEITKARLLARPESRYCIDCQDIRERKAQG